MVASHCYRQQRAAAAISAALVRSSGLAPALVIVAPRQADPAVHLAQLGQLVLLARQPCAQHCVSCTSAPHPAVRWQMM